MLLRSALFVSALWAVLAAPSQAQTYYLLGAATETIDIVGSNAIAIGANGVRTAAFAQIGGDRTATIFTYQIDCAGSRVRLASKMRIRSDKSGLTQISDRPTGAKWYVTTGARPGMPYTDFVCNWPKAGGLGAFEATNFADAVEAIGAEAALRQRNERRTVENMNDTVARLGAIPFRNIGK